MNRNTFCLVPALGIYQDSKRISYLVTHSQYELLRIREETETGIKHQPSEEKTRDQQPKLRSYQSQMPRCQFENTINRSQKIMFLLEISNYITTGSEYFNITETHTHKH